MYLQIAKPRSKRGILALPALPFACNYEDW